MKKFLALALMSLSVCGCAKDGKYYRDNVGGGYTYWRETHPTTFHGICANMYSAGGKWAVEHPHGSEVSKKGDGVYVSQGTEVRVFTNMAEAENWADSVCPTKPVGNEREAR